MKTSPILTPLAVIASLAGCGGSSSLSGTNSFAGSYTGNLTLDGGKQGALALTVASTGAATGTLTVSNPSAAPSRGSAGFSFSVGTTNISGTVGNDGTLNISGTDAGSGLFTVGGQLTSAGGNVQINAAGQTFTGALSASTGGGGTIAFSNGNGANADLSNYPANPMVFMSTVGGASSIVTSPPGGGNSRSLLLLLLSDAVAGSTVTYTGNLSNSNTFQYSEGGTKTWRATSGTASVVARASNSFQITFNNVTMTADTDTGATGSFTINGTLSK